MGEAPAQNSSRRRPTLGVIALEVLAAAALLLVAGWCWPRTLGLSDATRRGLGWRMWWSGPWLPTFLVTATKPDRQQ